MQASLINVYDDDELAVAVARGSVGDGLSVMPGGFVLLLCRQGRVTVEVRDEPIIARMRQLLMLPTHNITTSFSFSHDAHVIFVCISDKLLRVLLGQHIRAWNYAAFVLQQHVCTANDATISTISHAIDALQLLNDGIREGSYGRSLAHAHTRIVLLEACQMFERSAGESEKDHKTQTVKVFQRFLDLLDNEGTTRHSVVYYAKQLCITPKYLSIVCLKHSNRTAKDWVNGYMLEAVRRCLTTSDMSMKEISNKLGFPNASYFGRFVKEHFGTTPLNYRVVSVKHSLPVPSIAGEEAASDAVAAAK